MTTDDVSSQSIWGGLRKSTPARIGLGRAGNSLATNEVLRLSAAHAAARDAVHVPLDPISLAREIADIGIGSPTVVTSRARSREEYLRRPDLGRLPSDLSQLRETPADIGFLLADGLSPTALMRHCAGLLRALISELGEQYTLAPPVIAIQSRVALGDHVGAWAGHRTLLTIIGERPGLSVADSLSIYLTHSPRPGCTDAERNCISNIHPPDGLGYEEAAHISGALIAGARNLGRSGVELKDMSRENPITGPYICEVES